MEFQLIRLITQILSRSLANDACTYTIYEQGTQKKYEIFPKQMFFAASRYLLSGFIYEALKFETEIAGQTLGKIIVKVEFSTPSSKGAESLWRRRYLILKTDKR